jgi:hypothetical protein
MFFAYNYRYFPERAEIKLFNCEECHINSVRARLLLKKIFFIFTPEAMVSAWNVPRSCGNDGAYKNVILILLKSLFVGCQN